MFFYSDILYYFHNKLYSFDLFFKLIFLENMLSCEDDESPKIKMTSFWIKTSIKRIEDFSKKRTCSDCISNLCCTSSIVRVWNAANSNTPRHRRERGFNSKHDLSLVSRSLHATRLTQQTNAGQTFRTVVRATI